MKRLNKRDSKEISKSKRKHHYDSDEDGDLESGEYNKQNSRTCNRNSVDRNGQEYIQTNNTFVQPIAPVSYIDMQNAYSEKSNEYLELQSKYEDLKNNFVELESDYVELKNEYDKWHYAKRSLQQQLINMTGFPSAHILGLGIPTRTSSYLGTGPRENGYDQTKKDKD